MLAGELGSGVRRTADWLPLFAKIRAVRSRRRGGRPGNSAISTRAASDDGRRRRGCASLRPPFHGQVPPPARSAGDRPDLHAGRGPQNRTRLTNASWPTAGKDCGTSMARSVGPAQPAGREVRSRRLSISSARRFPIPGRPGRRTQRGCSRPHRPDLVMSLSAAATYQTPRSAR